MFFWYVWLGLVGGIDKDGSWVVELLVIGFGSVEVGLVLLEDVIIVVVFLVGDVLD